MKTFLFLWVTPIVLLFSWYGLSYYDINFGYRILTRELHDLVFVIYGNMLGLDPESIPPLVLKAIIVDTLLVIGFIIVKRRRKQIWAFIKSVFSKPQESETGLAESVAAEPELSRIS